MRESSCSTQLVSSSLARTGRLSDHSRPPEKPSADEYINFVTEVLAAANELLLDKLKLVCSSVLSRFGEHSFASFSN